MDALVLSSRYTVPITWNNKVCRCSGRRQGERDRVSLRSSYFQGQTDLMASSLKVAYEKQLRSGMGGRSRVVEANLATVTEESGIDDVSPTNSGSDDVSPTNLGSDDVSPTNSGSDDVSPTNSGSDDVARSVALLKTAAKTRKVSASEICVALRTLESKKFDPADFPSIIGGTKSPGRTWMLVFNSNKDEYNRAEGGGYYIPITAVQNFDAEASTIDNGLYFGPLGSLTFSGIYKWEKRKLAFTFNSLNLTIGSFGPLRIALGSKDKPITKDGPFFIWYYADDELVVAKGRAGGTAYWVRCAKVSKSFK